jgi:hypothetical protein
MAPYKILTMDNRARLHTMLDDLDDDEIIAAEAYLCSIVHRRHQSDMSEPELARLKERRAEFEKVAESHWREAFQRAQQGRGIVSSFGGGGSFGFDFRGRPIGKVSFSYGEGAESVEETLRFVAGQEVEIVNRVGLSPDGANLVYRQAVKSGEHTATWEESFPFKTV